MVKVGLKVKANLTNVDKLYPQTPEQFSWALKVKCTGCAEENPNWHLVCEDDVVELINAKANFAYKCKCCTRENHLTVIASNQIRPKHKTAHHKTNFDTVYTEADDDKFKIIKSFDCRGLELIDFEPRDGWAVESGQKVFEDVDLSNKDWVDYNDIDNVPVEISYGGGFKRRCVIREDIGDKGKPRGCKFILE